MKSLKSILKDDYRLPLQKQQEREEEKSSVPPGAPEFSCAICQDRGIVFNGESATPCVCMRQKRLENQFKFARMSRGLQNARFDSFRREYYESQLDPRDRTYMESAQKALQASLDFVSQCQKEKHGIGLLFTGPVGSGKTFLAACIANALMEDQKQVLFLVVPDLLDQLRATFKSEESELDLLDSAREIPVLVLDDLGAHNYTEWTRNRLYTIINYRLNEQLPTVITSNLSLAEMEEHLGARTTSRIIQACRIFRISVEQDIRHRQYQDREKNLMK